MNFELRPENMLSQFIDNFVSNIIDRNGFLTHNVSSSLFLDVD